MLVAVVCMDVQIAGMTPKLGTYSDCPSPDKM
jgi:hypothetical protein